jgi:hypothetical protein
MADSMHCRPGHVHICIVNFEEHRVVVEALDAVLSAIVTLDHCCNVDIAFLDYRKFALHTILLTRLCFSLQRDIVNLLELSKLG